MIKKISIISLFLLGTIQADFIVASSAKKLFNRCAQSPLATWLQNQEYKHPGESIALFTEKQLDTYFSNKDYLRATIAGNVLSFASFAAGARFIPALGAVRIGKITIPVKAFINLIASYVVCYTPIAYVYLQSKSFDKPKDF